MKYALEGKRAYEQGRNMAAVEAWHQAFELNPEDAVTVNNLALLLKEEHRFEEAVRLLEAGLQYSPDVAQLHYNLAVIAELYLLDLEKALVHYEEYREISGAGDKTVAGWIADLQRRLD
ncbi:tetratricopeptide repeat protein [Marinobacter sediminum]|uniref:tetratricopeptide repeat protein n=1 Tax=Marinobacter sediminum TaxID=256323 RepID=UPI00202FF619|nr:tetratricopeptide repeat protein [Marinobacter sediminum]